jgi:hypothetical protein
MPLANKMQGVSRSKFRRWSAHPMAAARPSIAWPISISMTPTIQASDGDVRAEGHQEIERAAPRLSQLGGDWCNGGARALRSRLPPPLPQNQEQIVNHCEDSERNHCAKNYAFEQDISPQGELVLLQRGHCLPPKWSSPPVLNRTICMSTK